MIVVAILIVSVYLNTRKTNAPISILDYVERGRFHINESRPPILCAKDQLDAGKILSNYIGEENLRTLTPPLSYKLSKEQWIKDRTDNGYLLGEFKDKNETDIYYEFIVAQGSQTARLRIFKCDFFKPANLDPQSPSGIQTLGYYRGAKGSVESMKKLIEYLFNLTGGDITKKYEIENNVFTYRFSYSQRSGDWNLEALYKIDSIYRIDIETGAVTLQTNSIPL